MMKDTNMSQPIVEVSNLSKKYADKDVLRDISLQVYEGDTIVIIGPSGT